MVNHTTTTFTPFIMANWNANGIRNKICELRHFLHEYSVDICIVTETHIDPPIKLKVPNYTTYRCDRIHHRGGGVAILAKRSLRTVLVNSDNTRGFEILTILLELPKQNIHISAVYNRPKHMLTQADFMSFFPPNAHTIIAGDLNTKHTMWGCLSTNKNGKILSNILKNTGFTIYAPTRPTHYPRNPEHRPDILDITITNTKIPIAIDVLNELSSDHLPTIASIGKEKDTENKPIKKTDWQLFQNTLIRRGHEQHELTTENGIDTAIEKYTTEIHLALTDSTELIPHNNDLNILPTNIRKVIHLRNWIRKQWQRTWDPEFKVELNSLNRKIKKLCREHKQQTWEDKIHSLCTTDCTLWKMAKTLKNTITTNRPIHGKTGLVYTETEKAEVFADSIETQFTVNTVPSDDDFEVQVIQELEQWRTRNTPEFNIPFASYTEITDIIKHLKIQKAPGHDTINNKIIKNLPTNSINRLTDIINNSIKHNYFPDSWKKATIVLFQKPGKDPLFPQNYRPISLLTSFSKIFERVIYNRLQPFLDKLPDEQHGFRKDLSTTKQLVRILEFIGEGIHNKESSAILMLDVAKAFDRVWHQGLILKLIRFDINTDLVHLLYSYLRDRKFRVKVGNTLSTERHIKASVPQGSILGPILYLIYVADFPMVRTHNQLTAFYADDTALIIRSREPNLAIRKLQTHNEKVEKWCEKWKVAINASKSKLMVIRKHKVGKPITQTLTLFSETVPLVKKSNYLGLVLNHRLTWTDHIKHVKGKAHGVLNKLKPLIGRHSKLGLQHKRTIYQMYIRPILTYVSPAWASLTKTDMNKLQITQNKALREMVGAPFYIRNSNIHKDLEIDTISNHIHKLNTNFYKKAIVSETANFNNTFGYELLREDIKIRPFAAFFLNNI